MSNKDRTYASREGGARAGTPPTPNSGPLPVSASLVGSLPKQWAGRGSRSPQAMERGWGVREVRRCPPGTPPEARAG